MISSDVQDLVQRLEHDDPLGIGSVRWSVRRLEDRRYSHIYLLEAHPKGAGASERADTANAPQLVLKVYRAAHPARRQREFDDLRRVYAALGPDAGVVRPVACDAAHGAIVTERARGTPFVRLVREACRRGGDRDVLARAAALCTSAGAWLRRFQERGAVEMCGEQPTHLGSPATFLAYVEERLRLLRAARPGIEPALCDDLLMHATMALGALPAGALGPVTWSHADFGPHNLLVDGDRLVVLDFELAPEHPFFDAAYYVESLSHAGGPLVDPSRVVRLERAFLAGYATFTETPLFTLFRLRHVVCAYVSETRRAAGLMQFALWPGLLAMRTRLRQLLHALPLRAATRVA
jgi:Ser/Thr protein kinase RdoA (MazF antagonist)